MTDETCEQGYWDTVRKLISARNYFLEKGNVEEVKRAESALIRLIPGYHVAESIVQWLLRLAMRVVGCIVWVVEFAASLIPTLSSSPA